MGIIQLLQRFLRFFSDSRDSQCQQAFPARSRLTVSTDRFPVYIDHAVITQCLHIFGSHSPPAVQHTFFFPVIGNFFFEYLLSLFTEVEGIKFSCTDGIKFPIQYGAGAVRTQDTASRLKSGTAHQKLIILYVNILFTALITETVGFAGSMVFPRTL